MSPSPNLIFVYVPCPNLQQAKELARSCLEKKLIACANISGPGTSLYRWEGKIEESDEVIMMAKTDEGHWPLLEKFIDEHHPYETPCIAAIPCSRVNLKYQEYLQTE